MGRDRPHEAELVRAEPERRPDWRVELPHRATAERLDGVVERPHPLHGPVGELHREGPVAALEPLGRGAERTVGVGALVEDAPDDLEGDAARRHRSPRRNSS